MSEKPIPLGIIIGSMMRGGTETHLAETLPALVALGFVPSVFVLGPMGPVAQELRNRGIMVFPDAPIKVSNHRFRFLRRLQLLARLAPALWAFALRQRHGVMNVYLPHAVIVCGLLLWPWRKRMFVSQRGLFTYRPYYPTLFTTLERFAFSNAPKVLANSRALEAALIEDGVPPERIAIVNNGLSDQRLSPDIDRAIMRQKLCLDSTQPVAITVANLHRYKGHMDVLNALGLMKKRGTLPGDLRWLIVGRDDGFDHEPVRNDLVKRAEALDLEKQIRFLGAREDVPHILRAADIGIHPSHEEGSSNAVIEMMGAGLPIIGTKTGGTPEALDDGKAGILVAAHAPKEIAKALESILESQDLRQALGNAARKRATEAYSLEQCVLRYASLYRDLMASL